MSTTTSREEMAYLVRALSHDMSANFMLLESSFAQLKKSLSGRAHAGLSYAGRAHQSVGSQVAHVDACLRESKRFLDDLLRLVQTGNVDMEPGRVETSEVVDEVLFEQRELLRSRDVEVSVDTPLPVFWCNQGRLKQVITNLVRNAVHHGCDRRQPRITIAPCVLADNGSSGGRLPMAAFEVHDNGPGIDRRAAREIFLPGRRLAAAHAEGSGTGLAIVKKIVEYYDGSALVDPNCCSGTRFVVVLPALETGASESRPEKDPLDAGGRRWKLEPSGHREEPVAPLHGSAPVRTHGR